MTNPVAQLSTTCWTPPGETESVPLWEEVRTYCPGCDALHPFRTKLFDSRYVRNDGTAAPTWEWDGNLEKPTFNPSLLCYSSVHLCQHTYTVCPTEIGGECNQTSHMVGYRLPDGTAIAPKVWAPVPEGAVKVLVHDSPHDTPAWGNCHSFLRAGIWDFLGDCAHALAGQKVPMVPLPDWLVKEVSDE